MKILRFLQPRAPLRANLDKRISLTKLNPNPLVWHNFIYAETRARVHSAKSIHYWNSSATPSVNRRIQITRNSIRLHPSCTAAHYTFRTPEAHYRPRIPLSPSYHLYTEPKKEGKERRHTLKLLFSQPYRFAIRRNCAVELIHLALKEKSEQ